MNPKSKTDKDAGAGMAEDLRRLCGSVAGYKRGVIALLMRLSELDGWAE